jgi:hypothetical protein
VSVTTLVVLVQIFLGAWQGPALSLGEVARREAARRASAAPSVRGFTDADVGPPPARPTVVAPPGAAAVTDAVVLAADGTKVEKPEEKPGEKKDEPWWRARITQAREALDRDRLLVTALESRVGALTTDVTNRDDPAQRAELINQRVRVLAELDRMRLQVVADQKAIAAIEEDARKGGVLPAWIRQ